jgi:cell division transport system ATP-binding protein
VIRFDNVSKRYETGYEALARVDFEVEAGEMVFLTGHSGAGKSTLMKMILLMEQPSNGNVFVDGHHLAHMPIALLSPQYRCGVPEPSTAVRPQRLR